MASKRDKKKAPFSKITLHGFTRVQISNPDGSLAGDSGWRGPNQIVNDGILNYLVHNLGKSAGSCQIGYVALGEGTDAPNATDTTLASEIMASTQRKAVTYGSVGSTTAQFTATFSSSDSFLSAAVDLANIGLFNSDATDDTLFAGNTFDSSSCDTNQNVNVTYQIRFATA